MTFPTEGTVHTPGSPHDSSQHPVATSRADNRPFTGLTALVTGGSRGVGRAICVELSRCGADVAFTYRRDEAAADQTLEMLTRNEVRGLAILASVDVPEQNVTTVDTVMETFGGLDILINNAGVVSSGREVVDTPPGEVERMMRIHALGPMQLCQLAVPAMRRRGGGRIVMVSSTSTRTFLPRAAPYAMAKAAGEALAFSLAAEEASYGIRVNVVAPGLVDTDMGRRLVAARPDGHSELGDSSTPDEVAGLVRYVVSDANTQTGHRFGIEGGVLTN